MTASLLLLLTSLTCVYEFTAPADSIDIVFVGDAMQHERQLKAARQSDGVYDFSPCYSAVRAYIESADYAVVNLETPLGGAPYSGYPMFCAPDSYAAALKDAGFDLFLTANNHTLDRRDRGLRRTIAALDSLGVDHIGTYVNPAARDASIPFIKDLRGFKVGFLNYTYGTNGIDIQGDVVVNKIARNRIADDVRLTREGGAEIIAVCIHWGEEYQLLPTRQQRQFADYLADLGVDMIIGAHPHVIQPMEMRCDSVQNKSTLLCYSLGNFISAMRTTDTRGGAMVRVTLTRDLLGNAIVDKASYRMVFTIPAENGEKNFRLIPAEENAPAWIEIRRKSFINNASRIFDAHNKNVMPDTIPTERYRSFVKKTLKTIAGTEKSCNFAASKSEETDF